MITHTINNCKTNSAHANLSPHIIWEKNKIDIREATQSYSKQKGNLIRNRCTLLENRLRTLHQLQDSTSETNEILKTEIITAEKELDSIYDYKAKGAQIRARTELIEQDEKNTKLF